LRLPTQPVSDAFSTQNAIFLTFLAVPDYFDPDSSQNKAAARYLNY
jgi:hypothetical protein